MIDFTGKTAFVTGAASGMGRACAIRYAEAGADVALADINEKDMEPVLRKITAMGRRAKAYRMDVSNKNQVEDVVGRAWSDFGAVDAFANAAGIVLLGLLREVDDSVWEKTIDVNLRGTYLTCNAMSKRMMERKSGAIVTFSSIAGKLGESYNVAYCASKGGVSLFTQGLALEMAPFNVRVNSVAPGKIMTEQTVGAAKWWAAKRGITTEQFYSEVVATVPCGRWGTPEEVADCVLFLSSGMSTYITGQVITVAGGQTLI